MPQTSYRADKPDAAEIYGQSVREYIGPPERLIKFPGRTGAFCVARPASSGLVSGRTGSTRLNRIAGPDWQTPRHRGDKVTMGINSQWYFSSRTKKSTPYRSNTRSQSARP